MPQSKEVEDFLQSIGPFYEGVEESTRPADMDVLNSDLTNPPEQATIDNTVTITGETEENKEEKSDSEEEIFSDPLATPQSLSVSS